ncbi:MAG TPA: phosphatase PAP2 family protein [Gemmatimonadales bacterium]|nr:phosphatase PAP2 family protein [Gemmatimonadales bacterium]
MNGSLSAQVASWRRAMTSVATLLLVGAAPPLCAQQAASPPHVIRWWEGAAVVGGIALLSTLDESVQQASQAARSPFRDDLAAVTRHMGQPEVFVSVPAAMLVTGLVTHRPGLERAAGRVAASLLLAGGLTGAGKLAVGRLRPNQATEAYLFKPFSGADALPSGHTTMAFALATALSDELHRPWASVALFVAAAATGWSRLNDNKHWLSDIAAGAAVGIASTQLIEGRWTVFHLRPPSMLVASGRFAVGWHTPVRLP